MFGVILLLHLLGATIWTGGHLVLALCILPGVLKARSVTRLVAFEQVYERLGMTALAVQIVTGLWLAHRLIPDITLWLDGSNPLARGILVKLTLLLLTAIVALDARLRVIPRLDEQRLNDMAWHIIAVTILSVLFVAAGVAFRTGWWF